MEKGTSQQIVAVLNFDVLAADYRACLLALQQEYGGKLKIEGNGSNTRIERAVEAETVQELHRACQLLGTHFGRYLTTAWQIRQLQTLGEMQELGR